MSRAQLALQRRFLGGCSCAGPRDAKRLAELATDVGGEIFALDATSTGEVEACLRRAVEVFGRVDGVANCVGSLLLKPAHAIADQEWNSALATNLGSAFAVVRAAGLVMAAHGGSVVLVSSAAARIGLANHEAIAAAKASAGMHPLGRIRTPEEIASAIGWLLDAEQAWVTGQVIGVDGGLSRVRSRS
jgi:3-oxoacyl-[acyl-carrier protein] reductase